MYHNIMYNNTIAPKKKKTKAKKAQILKDSQPCFKKFELSVKLNWSSCKKKR